MFQTCPLKYKYEYIDGLKDKYGKPRPYFTMGAHVHRSLKRFYDEYKAEQRNAFLIEDLLRQEWKKNRKGFSGPEDERFWGTLAINMLRNYVENNDICKNPFQTEEYQKNELTDGVECIGVIDRIDENEDGTLSIIDYKTSRKASMELGGAERRQVLTYAWIIEKSLKRGVKDVSLHYLINNSKVSTAINQEMLIEIEDDLHFWSKKIRNEKEYPAKLNKNCSTCDYQEICPLFKEKQNT